MIVQELIDELQKLDPEQKQMPAYCHDGMDPSDPCEIQRVLQIRAYYSKELRIELSS